MKRLHGTFTIRSGCWYCLGAYGAVFFGDDDEIPDVQSGQFNPDIVSPCNWAINRYGIARPPGVEGTDYYVNFQVELWAPFVSTGGLAIEEGSDWAEIDLINGQPAPFLSETDALNGDSVGNIFNGVIVNCVVADSDVFLPLINYNITLVGKIVFTKIIIF
jgi:hypothetical protein